MAAAAAAAATLFTAALLLFAAASPTAKVSAQPIINGLDVTGRLCCTGTGNCLPRQRGLGGVTVALNCTIGGRTATYGVAITDINGVYTFIIPAASLPGLALGRQAIPCTVVVPLPVRSAVCTVLSIATGFLVGTVRGVGTVVTALLGLVQTATVDVYVRVG